jgi:hypothetical protein
MPERLRTRRTAPPTVVAAAQLVPPNPETKIFTYASWQDEAWDFYRNLGEFGYAVTWMANSLAQVRLTVAEAMPGGDEPEPVTEGPAVDLLAEFGGDTTGQSALMAAYSTHLDVPGECWTVAEDVDGVRTWAVKSAKEVRPSKSPMLDPRTGRPVLGPNGQRRYGLQVQYDDNKWRPVAADSLAFRTWVPDQEFSWRPYSAARAALATMRKIDLYDRHIIATLVSRLAMNGFLIIPTEVTFPVRPEFKDAPDPFIAELVEFASRNIKNPGSAGAALPFPLRVPYQFIDRIIHLAIANGVSKDLLEARASELKRLADQAHLPQEIMTGTGRSSHWNAAQIKEEAIKTFVNPRAEVIVAGITRGWLRPALTANRQELVGPNGYPLIVWYDASELATKPDRTPSAIQLYDRVELSGASLRREAGFAETDKPEGDELRDQLLKKLVAGGDPNEAPAAYKELTGEELTPPADQQTGDQSGFDQFGGGGGQGGGFDQFGDTTQNGFDTYPTTYGQPPPQNTNPPVRQAAARSIMAHLTAAAATDREAPTNGHVLVLDR